MPIGQLDSKTVTARSWSFHNKTTSINSFPNVTPHQFQLGRKLIGRAIMGAENEYHNLTAFRSRNSEQWPKIPELMVNRSKLGPINSTFGTFFMNSIRKLLVSAIKPFWHKTAI